MDIGSDAAVFSDPFRMINPIFANIVWKEKASSIESYGCVFIKNQ
jgi:hypothetical protein